jgi:hypothetical protein
VDDGVLRARNKVPDEEVGIEVGLASRSGNAAQERSRMSKRKSNKSRKPDAAISGVAKPKRAVSASDLAGSEGEVLQAAPETETRLPELPTQETETKLPPVPPPEVEFKPALPVHLAEPKPDVAPPVGVGAEAMETAGTATGEARTASPSPGMDGPRRAMAGMEACQTLFMEMTRDNLDFAASLASMRSPLDIVDVATKFAGRRIGMYGRFSKAVADIASGRRAPMT